MTSNRIRNVLASLAIGAALAGCNSVAAPDLQISHPSPKALPEQETSYLTLGRNLLAANQPQRATRAFLRSLNNEGLTAEALTGAGVAAERQGLLNQARHFFEQARDQAPDSVMVYNNLGAVLYRMGEYQAARNAFRRAFALSSGTSTIAEHNLGLSEMALTRIDTLPTDYNPYAVRRLGSSEYELPSAQEAGNPG